MTTESKSEKVREWFKVFIPIVVLLGGWALSNVVICSVDNRAKERQATQQIVEQERTNDIAIADMVIKVLNEGKHYAWLIDLINTMKDDTLKKVMAKAIILDTSVPNSIKEDINTIVSKEENAESDAGKQVPETRENREAESLNRLSSENEGIFRGEYTVIVVYMIDDDKALDRSQKICDYLNSRGYQCEKWDWSYSNYVSYYGSPSVHGDLKDTAEILYYDVNDQERNLALNVNKLLSGNPELGNFKIKITPGRVFPMGEIAIIIPNTITNPAEAQ